MHETQTVIIGAGPHGLAAAAHLRRAGVEATVFGDPMSFWRTMPKGMLLRSNWTATSIAEYDGPLSLDSYCTETGIRLPPAGSARPVHRLRHVGAEPCRPRTSTAAPSSGSSATVTVSSSPWTTSDRLAARRVVVAAGIAAFVHRPAVTEGLPSELVSHTSEHDDLGRLPRQTVLVVGGGQSALESAALLHESGADVEVAGPRRPSELAARRQVPPHARHAGRRWCTPRPTSGRWASPASSPCPDLFRRLPRAVQEPMAYRAIRPAGAAWLRPRLRGRADPRRHAGAVRRGRRRPPAGRSSTTADPRRSTTCCSAPDTGSTSRRYPFLDPDLAGGRAERRRLPACCGRAWSPRFPACTSSARRRRGASGRSCGSSPAAGTAPSRCTEAPSPSARRARVRGSPPARERVTVTSALQAGRRPGARSPRAARSGRWSWGATTRGWASRGASAGRRPGRAWSTTSARSRGRRASSPTACGCRTCATPTRRSTRSGRRAPAVRARRLGALPDPRGDRRRSSPRTGTSWPSCSGCPRPAWPSVAPGLGQARDLPARRAARRCRCPRPGSPQARPSSTTST